MTSVQKLLVAFLFAFNSYSAFSQNGWKLYTVSADSVKKTITTCYIDTNYFAFDRYGYGKVWVRFEIDYPLKKRKNALMDDLYSIDCAQKRIVLWQTIKREPANSSKIIKVFKYTPSENDWQDISPGSVGQLLLQSACELLGKAKE